MTIDSRGDSDTDGLSVAGGPKAVALCWRRGRAGRPAWPRRRYLAIRRAWGRRGHDGAGHGRATRRFQLAGGWNWLGLYPISKGTHAKAAVGEGAEFLGAASIAVFQRCLVYFLAASLLTDRVCRRPCECAPRVARCASTSSHIMLITWGALARMRGGGPLVQRGLDCLTTS